MKFRIGQKLGFSQEVDFFLLTATWYFFASLFATHRDNPSLFHAWVLLTSVVSLFSLSANGFFSSHNPAPKRSSIVTLLLILPISAFLGKWLLMLTSHIPPVRYTGAFKIAVCVAVVFELLHLVVFKLHLRMGRKWFLSTHLAPEELAALRAQIQTSGISEWTEVHPYHLDGKSMRGNETVVISRKAVRHLKDHPELLNAHLRGQRVVDVRDLLKEFRGRVSLQNADGWTFLLGSNYQTFLLRLYFYVKEIVEALLAIILLILLAPAMILLAVGVLISLGRPILYRQERLGYRGKKFMLYKFRTMPVTAEDDGPQWASEADPRLNPFGQWLRRTRMDELPQLLQVIRGDLSFVGPRPERPEFYKILSEHIPLFSTRLLVRPGITGWAQVSQGYAASVEESKTKLEYDLFYVQNMSPSLDLHVLISTVTLMFRGNSGR